MRQIPKGSLSTNSIFFWCVFSYLQPRFVVGSIKLSDLIRVKGLLSVEQLNTFRSFDFLNKVFLSISESVFFFFYVNCSHNSLFLFGRTSVHRDHLLEKINTNNSLKTTSKIKCIRKNWQKIGN